MADRTRTHRIIQPPDPSFDDFGPEDDRDFWRSDAWLEPARPQRRRGAQVDHRLTRAGAVVALVVVLVPVALAVADRSGGESDDSAIVATRESVRSVNDGPPNTGVPITAAATLDPGVLAAEAADGNDGDGAAAPGEKGRPNAVVHDGGDGDELAEAECAGTYTVVVGDTWWRFGETSGASYQEWLDANDAQEDTQLNEGDELCIPAGASAPAPPAPGVTAAPATTAAPVAAVEEPAAAAVTEPVPAAAQPAIEAPTTTSSPPPPPPPQEPAPAPTPAAPAAPTTPGGVEALIREVWPDDLEERALTIARRESGLRPDAYNGWCCYGVFQIYFNANRSFLGRYGVTSANQLLDARTNVTIAYEMHKASGWSPWSQTDPGG
jgi:LysM repeat protein